MRRIAAFFSALSLLTFAPGALAEGTSLRADLVEGKSVKLDGLLKEWSSFFSLSHAVKGRSGKPDIEARAAISYDANNVYIAADVTDDTLRAGADHVEIVLGFPGGAVHEVELFPGDPGKSPGAAKAKDGSTISGAKVVEAPKQGGYTLEASVPWSAFPPASRVRVGLRGAIFVHDADAGSQIKNVIGTASSASYAGLPSLSTEAEQALFDGLLKDKGIRSAPKVNLIADVAGDAMKERVLVFERYLVVLGSNFRKGSEYYYGDIGVDPSMLVSCEAKDLTGDGKDELIFRKRVGSSSKYREMIQVQAFGASDTPSVIFQHEVGINGDIGSVVNEVSFVSDGAKTAIKITPGRATGYNAGNYKEPTETAFDGLLLPWGSVASQLYKYSGSGFSKASEERQAPTAPPAGPVGPGEGLPKPPPPPSAAELLDKVYDLYKKDRGVSGRPRFDLAVDVTGGAEVERVLVHDRDVVVFGKGFKGGTGYTFLSLQQFASSSDITEVTAKDLTGDGKAEILVKGVVHANAPPSAGGGTVDREVVIVLQMVGDGLKRVFAAEVGRAIGKKKIIGSFRVVGAGRGVEIELAPGSAIEWTDKTYPFNQDTGTVGGFEPLLLPWGGNKPQRYKWGGAGFSK